MSVATKSGVPCIITAGDTQIFTIGPDYDYPNTGWTAKFVLSRDGKTLGSWTAANAATGLGFQITIPAADTAKMVPGRATWSEVYTETATGQRQTGCTGILTVTPDPTQSLPETASGRALAAANAAIERLTGNEFSQVNFNGQSYTTRNLKDLMDVRDRLQVRVDAELRELGVSSRGGVKRILFRF